MPIRTITIDPVLVGTNGVTSKSQPLPNSVTEIIAQFTSPDWDTLTGTIDVAVQCRIDGTWQDTITVEGIVIGQITKGGLPKFSIGSDVLLPATAVRIIVKPTVAINLGLVITLTYNG